MHGSACVRNMRRNAVRQSIILRRLPDR